MTAAEALREMRDSQYGLSPQVRAWADSLEAEIERLRELVESAYRDGWQDGSVRDPFGNVGSLDDWERSDTKAALAGKEETK
jgi:hypothetical protein